MNQYLVDNILLPEAYVPLEVWSQQHPDLDPQGPELANQIRIFRGQVLFVFDDQNPRYRTALEECKAFSKALNGILNGMLRNDNTPVYTGTKRPNASERAMQPMSFLVRPPYLASRVPDKSSRMSGSNVRDDFMLHFGENGVFQCTRIWDSDSARRMKVRRLITEYLHLYQSDLTLFRTQNQPDQMAYLLLGAIQTILDEVEDQ